MTTRGTPPEPGEGHLYSSKPPLFPTIMAGEYWLIVKLTGWTLATHPFAIGRFMLVTINLVAAPDLFRAVGKAGGSIGDDRLGAYLHDGLRHVGHLPVDIRGGHQQSFAGRRDGSGDALSGDTNHASMASGGWWYFALAGFLAAFTAMNELPGMSLLGVTIALVGWHAPRQTLLAFVPPALLVAVAAFGTNYLAHHTWAIPYAHRGKRQTTGTTSGT